MVFSTSQTVVSLSEAKSMVTIWLWLTVRHGKIHHAIKFGKPSISIRAIYPHGELLVISPTTTSPWYADSQRFLVKNVTKNVPWDEPILGEQGEALARSTGTIAKEHRANACIPVASFGGYHGDLKMTHMEPKKMGVPEPLNHPSHERWF